MRRRWTKRKPLWRTLTTWACISALIWWGLWQARELRRAVQGEILRGSAQVAAEGEPAASPTASATAAASSASPSVDPPQDSVIRPSIMLVGLDFGAPDQVSPDDPNAAMSVDELLAKAPTLLEAGRIVEARAALNMALWKSGESPTADRLRRQLTELNYGLLLGSAVLPDDPAAWLTEIRRGDTFIKLARQYQVPAAFLEAMNPSLNPRDLKPLSGVKVVQGPFHLLLVKHARRLDLYLRDLYVRSYSVQLDEGNHLPEGDYCIAPASKIQVGSRLWIGFEGIDSGTQDVTTGWFYGSAGPRSGASNQSTGIRAADEDLCQLYSLVTEIQSLLRVHP